MRYSSLLAAIVTVAATAVGGARAVPAPLPGGGSSTTTTVSSDASTGACNGRVEYCSRLYSNVTQVAAHDSAFVGILPTENQYISVTDQLDLGVRFLQAQTHLDSSSVLSMCHTSCTELNAGTLEAYLTTIKTWLDANTNEVLTLLLVNGDFLSPTVFATAFEAAGLDSYAYAPSGTLTLSQWPTLQALINAGKRLVVFLDYDANTSEVAYLLPEFTYFFETPYDVTSTDDFAACAIDRPSGASASGRMYIVNHFLDEDILGILIPNSGAASTTNSESSILAQAQVCEGLYSNAPKAVLLDYISQGTPFAAELAMNNLS
ncbi:hypothetical protein HK405_007904 [Cladochytrium tenue]|nr:hypothetical protein HK405_007904 [Cladochytrium tenue]